MRRGGGLKRKRWLSRPLHHYFIIILSKRTGESYEKGDISFFVAENSDNDLETVRMNSKKMNDKNAVWHINYQKREVVVTYKGITVK